MASVSKPSFLSPPGLIRNGASPTRRVHIGIAFTPKNLKVSSSSLCPFAVKSSSPLNSSEELAQAGTAEVEADPVKLAFAKAKEYKKRTESKPSAEIAQNSVDQSAGIDKKNEDLESKGKDEGEEKVPLGLKLAFEKVKEYKKNKGVVDESEAAKKSERSSGMKKDVNEKGLKISSVDFLGLEFSEKKKGKGLPAGLVPVVDSFPEGELPEVEILVGDASKFGDGDVTTNFIQEEDLDVYKPKVSTWGVFPRPTNISKTYGGGRTLRPGEVLETADDRAAKEARTRQLLSAYKSKIGLNVPPKLKFECEKALNDGNSLMDLGKLKEALPFYEKIMNKLAFQTELYGLAALQWSICQDSLSRPNDARSMYDKLQSHPNPQVRTRARQLNYGFQAMKMMKVTSSSISARNTGYQKYFDAFVKDKSNYSVAEAEADEEGALKQALPYVIILLLAPILSVILIAVVS